MAQQTSFIATTRTTKALRLVRLTQDMADGHGMTIADGQTVSAERTDGTVGTAEGETVLSETGTVWAVFAAPLAAGRWRFAVASPA